MKYEPAAVLWAMFLILLILTIIFAAIGR